MAGAETTSARTREETDSGLLRSVLDRLQVHHVSVLAAGVAFDVFLSIFPGLIAAVSLYGLVSDPATVEQQLASLSGVLPPSALEVVRHQLGAIVSVPRQALGWGAGLSLVLVLWAAARGAGALMEGVNIAYELVERRGFLQVRLVALAFSLGFVLFLLLCLALIAAVPALVARVDLPAGAVIASRVIQWTLLAGLITVLLSAVYRYGPSRPPARGHGPGSAVAALLWLAGSALFSWYAENFGRYIQTYGALAGVAVLLLWLQLSFFAVLLGAEVNAARERGRAAPPRR
jgi:membrane protein